MGGRAGGGSAAGGGFGSGSQSRNSSISSKRLKGYNGIFQPKGENTSVLGWLKSNKIWVSESDKDVLYGMKFKDVKKGADYSRAETFIRDLIHDGAKSVKTKKK